MRAASGESEAHVAGMQVPHARAIIAEVRVDAINVLNHSNWGNPNLDINSTNFGRITSKTGNRTFTINARLNF